MASVADLSTSFETLTFDPSMRTEDQFVTTYRQFMSERAEFEAIQGIRYNYFNLKIPHFTRLLVAATVTPLDALSATERVELLANTATTLNDIPGVSGRRSVRSGLRSLERFYLGVVNFSEPTSLLYPNHQPNGASRLFPITMDCFSKAQDLRAWNTGDIASKSPTELLDENLGIVANKMFESLELSTVALYHYAQVRGESAFLAKSTFQKEHLLDA